MMRLLICALIFVGSPALAADWTLDCPAQISTTQSIGGALPDGWSAIVRTPSSVTNVGAGAAIASNSPSVSISVFDGPPTEMADLVPDNPNAKVQRWTFGKKRTRDIYIVCNYADTRMKLTRKTPKEVASCSLRAKGAATGVVCK